MKSVKRICVLLLMLPAVTRCLGIAHEEDTGLTENQDDNVNIQHEYQREKRSRNTNPDPRQNCNTWSPWINRHHPTVIHPNDRENVSQQEMDTFCQPQHGGRVSDILCQNEHEEPFFGNQTDPYNERLISCYSPFVGVECVVLRQTLQCYDMSMKYFCSCTNETPVTSSTDTMYEYIEMRYRFEESGNIWQIPHTNILRCGRRCLADPLCASVFFEETSSRCTAHKVVLRSGSLLSNVRYFIVKQ